MTQSIRANIDGDLQSCPFCLEIAQGPQVASNGHAVALLDAHPVSSGHVLVVSVEHVANLFDLSYAAQAAMWRLVSQIREDLYANGITAFTIGANIGTAAGQTVSHAHVHLIPRRPGDVEDPRGGIRCVIPDKARWEDNVSATPPQLLG